MSKGMASGKGSARRRLHSTNVTWRSDWPFRNMWDAKRHVRGSQLAAITPLHSDFKQVENAALQQNTGSTRVRLKRQSAEHAKQLKLPSAKVMIVIT